jgi:hypothetical protein
MVNESNVMTPEKVSLDGNVLRIGRRHFPLEDVDGIRQIVQREAEFWDWLPKVSNYVLQREFERYSRLQALCADLDGYGTEVASVPEYWAEEFVQLYSQGRILLSGSPMTQLVKSIAADDSELAAYVLYELVGGNNRVDNHKAVEAIVIAALFRRGIRKNVESERAALQRLREDWEDGIEEVKAEHQRMRGNFELQLQEAIGRFKVAEEQVAEYAAKLQAAGARQQELHESQVQRFEEEVEQYRGRGAESVEALHESVAAGKEELNRLTAAYNEHMALKSPVAYWQENGDTHHASAKTYLRSLAIAAPIAILLLTGLGWFLLGTDENPPLGHMILFFMFSGLLVWFFRVLTRLYLSHKHLEIDARERIVAAKTYLALVGEGIEAREAERTIIMGTLFRPAAIGVMQDDAMPASSVELVGRLMKGDK